HTVIAVNTPNIDVNRGPVEVPTPIPPTMDVWRGAPTYMNAETMPRPSFLVLENRSVLLDQFPPLPYPPAPVPPFNGPPLQPLVQPLEVLRPLVNDILPPPINRPNYRIIRQPRAVPSAKPVILPKEVVLELLNLDPAHTIARDQGNSIWMRGVST